MSIISEELPVIIITICGLHMTGKHCKYIALGEYSQRG